VSWALAPRPTAAPPCAIITYGVGVITYRIGDIVPKEAIPMLAPLFGSEYREKALIFILARESGYAAEIAQFFATNLSQIQKQLDGLEAGGVLVSQTVGRTRLYEFSPRYVFREELKNLLQKALLYYPADMKRKLALNRRRPRRRGKPL
jgi:hypothetical protein